MSAFFGAGMDDLERTLRWASTEPAAFVVALFVVQALILAIHEIGHVLGARSQGVTVIEYRLGLGPGIRIGRWGACAVVLGIFPFGGRVTYARADIPILSRTLISASGAFSTGAAGAVGLAALAFGVSGIPAKLFVLGCFLDCMLGLSPLSSDGRKVADGLWRVVVQREAR